MDDDTSGQQINIQIAHISRDIKLTDKEIKRIIKHTCRRFDITKSFVSIAIVNDKNIRQINKKFLNSKNTTDCISFDLSDSANEKCFEIIVNSQLAQKQTESREHDCQTELALYIIHGLLHQMGYDDQTEEDAEKMHAEEEKILRELDYEFSYN